MLVEEKFERTGRILHLHLANGFVIRTTPEHPFYIENEDWTEAAALQPGNQLRTASGWIEVTEVFDTGEYEKVYNVRVAEYHTYFVSDSETGEAVWAHNAVCVQVDRTDDNWSERKVGGYDVYGTAQDSSAQHAAWINTLVDKYIAAKPPEGTYFVLNRTWRTALGRNNVPLGTPGANNRPDILIVQPLGKGRWKIHAIEVKSGGQEDDEMIARMELGWNSVNTHGGEIKDGALLSLKIDEFRKIKW